jgi:hypothetical protein
MKSISTLLVLALVPFLGIKAQKPLFVFEDSLQFGNSRFPAISVTIPEVDYNKTLKAWIKDLETGTRSKVITENRDMSIFGARIKNLSPNPVNVFSRLMNLDTILQLTVSYELKKDQYIEVSTGEAELNRAKNYLKDFAKNQYIDLAKSQADAEERKLRDLQRELSSLETQNTRFNRSIQTNNNLIAREKENIIIQNNELNSVSVAMTEHNNELINIEAEAAQKEKMDLVKELENRKKKALKSIESSEKKINKATNAINKATREMPRNERIQNSIKDQIAQQEAVYQKFADKLKTIRSY